MKKITATVVAILLAIMTLVTATAEIEYTHFTHDCKTLEVNGCVEFHCFDGYKADDNITFTMTYTQWETESGKCGGTYLVTEYAEDTTIACVINGLEDEDGFIDWDGTMFTIDEDCVEECFAFIDWYFEN